MMAKKLYVLREAKKRKLVKAWVTHDCYGHIEVFVGGSPLRWSVPAGVVWLIPRGGDCTAQLPHEYLRRFGPDAPVPAKGQKVAVMLEVDK
jgi:hypothetical protein